MPPPVHSTTTACPFASCETAAFSLSFIVAATQIGVEIGKLDPAAAAGLVTAGVISVLLFPALALRFLRPA